MNTGSFGAAAWVIAFLSAAGWAEQARPNLTSSLVMHNGVPVFTINGKAIAPMFVWGPSNKTLEKTAPMMKAEGFHFYTTCVNLPWPREGEAYDFSSIDAEMAALLKNDPDGLYMPRVWIEPPDWWKQQNPGEMPVWENQQRETEHISVTSEKWLTEACLDIDRLVRHLEGKWGNHIFAYHPSALHSGEWDYTSPIWSPPEGGLRHFEGTFRIAFQRWLKKKYGTIAKLNAAWRSNHGSFSDIDVPAAAARKSTRHGLLRNPYAERNRIDFTEFQSVAITDAIERVTRAFRQASGGRKLIYHFYGYTFELAGLQEGIANFGHLNLEGIMDNRGGDVWCAPLGYCDRRNGGSGPIMAPPESINFRGQVWCNEDDLRTHRSAKDAGWGRVNTPEETLWCHSRNFMASLVHRSQMWFMDQAGGWFEEEAIWKNLGVLRGLYEEVYAHPCPLKSDVAVIVDEKSLMQIAYGIEIGLPLLYDIRAQINRMGTTPEMWLQTDYLQGRVKDKKLVIFLNAFSLTDAQRKTIRNRLKADGATAIWFYAPGILTPDTASEETAYGVRGAEALTGITLVERDGEHSPAMRMIPSHTYARGMEKDAVIEPDDIIHNWQTREESFQFRQMTFPPRKKLSPLFAVSDARAEPAAFYADSPDISMAVKDVDGFRSVFVGGLTLPALVLANIAADAGVHLYCPPGDVIYTDGRFLSVTACQPGEKTITLPKPSRIKDVYTNTIVAEGDQCTIHLRLGETRIYRIEPASKQTSKGIK